MRLMGYLSELSVDPGQDLQAKVSANGAYDVKIVRLLGVDVAGDHKVRQVEVQHPATGTYNGRPQALRPGSFALAEAQSAIPFTTFGFDVWVRPTLEDRDRQVIVAVVADQAEASWSLSMTKGAIELTIGGRTVPTVSVPIGAVTHRWVRIAGGRDNDGAEIRYAVDGRWPAERFGANARRRDLGAPPDALIRIVSIGAQAGPDGHGHHCFNGRIENPSLLAGPSGRDWADADEANGPPKLGQATLAQWDFSIDISSRTITDLSANALHGVLVNRPGRGVRGHNWSGRFLRYKENPAEWAAIHFHDDDLNDAGWETDLSFSMPPGTPSGIYAVSLSQGDQVDCLPFYVRPAASTTNKVLFIAPTNTYLAYAHERLGEGERGPAH